MIKVSINKCFIVKGMEQDQGRKFQTISVKTGKQTSYVQIHIKEEDRIAVSHLLIKGQSVKLEGSLSILTSKYNGVQQKNPVIWVDSIELEFTPEQIAQRAKELESTGKISTGADTQPKIITPGKNSNIKTPEENIDKDSNVKQKIDITEHIELESNIQEKSIEEVAEMTDEEIAALLS